MAGLSRSNSKLPCLPLRRISSIRSQKRKRKRKPRQRRTPQGAPMHHLLSTLNTAIAWLLAEASFTKWISAQTPWLAPKRPGDDWTAASRRKKHPAAKRAEANTASSGASQSAETARPNDENKWSKLFSRKQNVTSPFPSHFVYPSTHPQRHTTPHPR